MLHSNSHFVQNTGSDRYFESFKGSVVFKHRIKHSYVISSADIQLGITLYEHVWNLMSGSDEGELGVQTSVQSGCSLYRL